MGEAGWAKTPHWRAVARRKPSAFARPDLAGRHRVDATAPLGAGQPDVPPTGPSIDGPTISPAHDSATSCRLFRTGRPLLIVTTVTRSPGFYPCCIARGAAVTRRLQPAALATPKTWRTPMRAKNVMSDEVITVNAGASVLEAARLLVNAQVSAMLVIDDHGVMVGILSEADVIRHTGGVAPTELSDLSQAMRAMDNARSRRVADVMTKSVVTATEDTTLHDVAELMMRHGIKRVPVLRGHSVVGMVSRVDLVQALISIGLEAYTQVPTEAQTADARTRVVRNDRAFAHELVADAARRCRHLERRRPSLGDDGLRRTARRLRRGRALSTRREVGGKPHACRSRRYAILKSRSRERGTVAASHSAAKEKAPMSGA